MPVVKERYAEPIPGYILHEPLGRGGFGEVWMCEAPGGLHKAVKFVGADHNGIEEDQTPILEELEAIQHIKSIRHPFLLSIERVELVEGELVIVMELADDSLLGLYNQAREEGAVGVEREELIRLLYEAADVLDVMNHRHGVLHLDIKPGNLFLVGEHIKVADFGQVQRFEYRTEKESGAERFLSAITPAYAAPELFRGMINPFSDQYSLAIVYQEVLTGEVPFKGTSYRQLAMEHTSEPPDLSSLPEQDRAIVAKALSKDPKQRFRSCKEFVEALRGQDLGQGQPVGPSALIETQANRPAYASFLPEYKLVKARTRTPATESWETRGPDGRPALIQMLYGVSGNSPRILDEIAGTLRSLEHPALPGVDVRTTGRGCLLLVSDLITGNVRERFAQCRSHGAKGIPRRRLLGWLRQAASALDDLAQRGLYHLGLNPQNLLLDHDLLLLGDFGLASLLWLPLGQLDGQIQFRYAPPEVLARKPDPASDQYSLAVIYQEMLTGVHPFTGRKPGHPNLAPVSSRDRAALARALEVDPQRRYRSNLDLIEALEQASPFLLDKSDSASSVSELLAEACDALPAVEPESWITTPEGTTVVESRFAASLPPRGAHEVFARIAVKWDGEIIKSNEESVVFKLEHSQSFFKRLLGRAPRLLVEIRWTHPQPPTTYHPQIIARISTPRGGTPTDLEWLRQLGPSFLDDLRTHMTGHNDRRAQERVLWTHPVMATFLDDDGSDSEPVEGLGKDLSLSGMGVYLPQEPPGKLVRLDLHSPNRQRPVTLQGRCVRISRLAEGWVEAGVLFE